MNLPSSSQAPASARPTRVLVHLRAVGSAPRLKKEKFKVPAAKSFAFIVAFLRKQLQVYCAHSTCM